MSGGLWCLPDWKRKEDFPATVYRNTTLHNKLSTLLCRLPIALARKSGYTEIRK